MKKLFALFKTEITFFFKKKSFYRELLFWLLSFTSSTIFVFGLINMYTNYKKDTIIDLEKKVKTLQVLCLKDFKLHSDFLTIECINPQFFISGHSIYLDKNEEIDDSIRKIVRILINDKHVIDFNAKNQIVNIKKIYDLYEITFDSINKNLFKRGFKDWGVEGRMRVYGHLLEKIKGIDEITILQLRRREKDYIIRNDTSYIPLVNKYCNQIINQADKKSRFYDSVLLYINKYKSNFNLLVNYETLLGLRTNKGLKNKADQISVSLDNELTKLENIFQLQQKAIYESMYYYYVLMIIAFTFTSIYMSMHIARRISQPIQSLSNHIDTFVLSEFNYDDVLSIENANLEVQALNANFARMQEEIIDYINYFKKKVDERTREISEQMEEITQQRNVIQRQKEESDNQHRNLTDSIKYAKRIKNAMLPDEEMVKALIPNSFIIYSAKDIVSGDFYFVDNILELSNEKIIVIAADGTGHGVPGAFMSLLGLNNIIRSIHGFGNTSLPVILSTLNMSIVQTLRKQRNKHAISDSMDMAICKFDFKNLTLEFVGANRPCFIIRNNKLIELKGNKKSIGSELSIELELDIHTIDLKKNDCVYLFSDGYCDQFGGNENKKFKKKSFINLLLSVHHMEMFEQKIIIEQVFNQWKGHEPQTDDVLVIGLKID